MNRSVEAAVFENGSDSILSEGLAYDRCQVGVITNVDGRQAFGRYDIEHARAGIHRPAHAGRSGAAGGRRRPQRQPADAGRHGAAVRRRSDLLCRRPRPADASSNTGRKASERYSFATARWSLPAADETAIVSLQGIPLTDGGRDDFQIENVLAASGAAWALGIGSEIIRTGLETFTVA
jgi:cyanophycin synthetase